jgi:hypothetical protein
MPTTEAVGPETIVEQLRALRDHVRCRLVQASINAVTESAGVAGVLGRSAADLRQETVDADRWTAVEDELRAMLNGVAAANLVRRHRIGLTALQTYNICRQLVRQKEHAALLPHVQGMKRLNKFGKKRAKTPIETEPKPTTA